MADGLGHVTSAPQQGQRDALTRPIDPVPQPPVEASRLAMEATTAAGLIVSKRATARAAGRIPIFPRSHRTQALAGANYA